MNITIKKRDINKMINIAICDDDEKDVDFLHNKFAQILKDNGIIAEFNKFIDPVKFMESLKENNYDLVFLDISMSPVSGLEIADYISKNANFTRIVFITNHDVFARKTFRYSPIAFISKKFFYEELAENIEIIFNKLKVLTSYFSVVINKIPQKIKIADIYYISTDRDSINNIIIHKTDGTQLIQRKTIKSVLDEINNDVMVQINKGIIVNVANIKKLEVNKTEIILDNGEMLTVSRNYYNILKEKYFKYERIL